MMLEIGGAPAEEIRIVPADVSLLEEHRRGLLDLFGEPDFYFKSFAPQFLSERDVLSRIVEEQTQLVLCGNELLGLWEASYFIYGGMIYELHYRVSSKASSHFAVALLDAMTLPFLRGRPVNNIVYSTLSHDTLGRGIFESSKRFHSAGTLEGSGYSRGRLQGMTYFLLTR